MPLFHKLSEAEKQLIGDIHTRTFHLLPCRHGRCGSRRLYAGRHHQESYIVKCLDCGCQTLDFRTLEGALENWGLESSAVPFTAADLSPLLKIRSEDLMLAQD